MLAELTAVRGGGVSKVWYNGQVKMIFGQGISFQTKSGHTESASLKLTYYFYISAKTYACFKAA